MANNICAFHVNMLSYFYLYLFLSIFCSLSFFSSTSPALSNRRHSNMKSTYLHIHPIQKCHSQADYAHVFALRGTNKKKSTDIFNHRFDWTSNAVESYTRSIRMFVQPHGIKWKCAVTESWLGTNGEWKRKGTTKVYYVQPRERKKNKISQRLFWIKT